MSSAAKPRRERSAGRFSLGRVSVYAWIVLGLMIIGAVLRFASISSQSYWADEALTVYDVRGTFGQMLGAVAHLETTPQLYFILAWAWRHVFGIGEAGLRSLSALAGIAVIPITYLCGRELVSRRAGVLAAALATVNPFMIWYSQEARSYMLLIAFSGASLLWALRAVAQPTRRNVALWAVFSALALATHFFAAFIVAPEVAWLLWRARNRIVVAGAAALAVVQAALLPLALQDTGHGINWIGQAPRLTRLAQVPTQFAVMTIYRRVGVAEGLAGGALVIAVVAALLMMAGGEAERRGARTAAIIAALVILIPLLIGMIRPQDDVFLMRNVSPAWIPLAIAFAAACSSPRAGRLGLTAAALMCALFIYAQIQIQTTAAYQRADWRGVAHAVGTTTEPRAILIDGGYEADALKVMIPGVFWNQPSPTQLLPVDEIDVVGSHSRAPLRGPHKRKGPAYPRRAVSGTVRLGGATVRNFHIARYELIKPWRLTLRQISARAGRFFRHRAPKMLLILYAPGTPRRTVLPGHARPVVAPTSPSLRPGRTRSAHGHDRRSHRHGHRHRRRHVRRAHRRLSHRYVHVAPAYYLHGYLGTIPTSAIESKPGP